MTFKKLKELMTKHNIPEDVKLLSDSGWEVEPTEMDGIFYNKKENYIIFTQDNESSDYRFYKDYEMLSLKSIYERINLDHSAGEYSDEK